MEAKLLTIANFELDVYKNYKRLNISDKRNTDDTLYIDTTKMTKEGDTFFSIIEDVKLFISNNNGITIGKYTFELSNNDIIIRL